MYYSNRTMVIIGLAIIVSLIIGLTLYNNNKHSQQQVQQQPPQQVKQPLPPLPQQQQVQQQPQQQPIQNFDALNHVQSQLLDNRSTLYRH